MRCSKLYLYIEKIPIPHTMPVYHQKTTSEVTWIRFTMCFLPKFNLKQSLAIHIETYQRDHLTVCYCHATHEFQIESTLYRCLNVKELLTRTRGDIWSLSDSNRIGTHSHLVRKRTLNHLKLSVCLLTKWLWVRIVLMPTYGSWKSFVVE